MSLIIQQASPEFLTRGQVPKQEERADKLQNANIFQASVWATLVTLSKVTLFRCLKQIKRQNPDTRCREPDSTWEELQSAVDTMGRICDHFCNLCRELISMGASPTIITILKRITMAQPCKTLMFPSPVYYSKLQSRKCPVDPPPQGSLLGARRVLAEISIIAGALAAKESGKCSFLASQALQYRKGCRKAVTRVLSTSPSHPLTLRCFMRKDFLQQQKRSLRQELLMPAPTPSPRIPAPLSHITRGLLPADSGQPQLQPKRPQQEQGSPHASARPLHPTSTHS